MVQGRLYSLMRCSKGVVTACTSIFLFSACLLYLAYSLVDEVLGVYLPEDVFEILEIILFTGVAIWAIATAIGALRLRWWARISAVWISLAAFLVYLPNLAKYIYLVKTAPDVGWSSEILYPLVPLFGLGIWWLILFTRPGVKAQFLQHASRVESGEK
jgi:hypothetical protein